MQSVFISGDLNLLATNLAFWRQGVNNNVSLLLDFRRAYLTPASLTMLSSWLLEMMERGTNFVIRAYDNVLHYLSQMGFTALLGNNGNRIRRFSKTGFFLPLQIMRNSDDQMRAVDQLCELVLKQFANARELLPAVEWAVNELTDNTFIHAQSPTPSVMCAQYFPGDRQMEIAIADQGLGLLGTLGPAHGAADAREAIGMALQRGLTCDPKIGQGNGLAGTERIAELNDGELMIWTGDTSLVKNEERQFRPFSSANGVGLALRLNVDKPVDLATTWIGQRPFTYIDRCTSLIEGSGIIFVRQECGSVGSRDAARRLRNKLLAVLPDIENRITLDFTGCGDPSSSFLDELFGRLIGEIGLNRYQQAIRLAGLKTTDIDRANVVIHQRLHSLKMAEDLIDYAPF